MPKTGEMFNMFNPFGLCSIKNVLKTGEMFNLFNVSGKAKTSGLLISPQNIEQIEHIEHFPCFKHILIGHKPKGLNILSISLVLATF